MHHLSGEDHIKDLVTVVQNILLVIMSQVNKGKFLSIILQVLNVTVTVFEYTVISIKSFMTYVHDFITSSF
jgi:cell shape-determining protein MreC